VSLSRALVTVTALLVFSACDVPSPAQSAAPAAAAPRDTQHQGITTPHGDHSPHHGGIVLMNGELHYEVVLARDGVHRIWFSNAVRDDLPASVARDVRLIVARPGEPEESLALEIDDAGESWLARGKPVTGNNVMTKVSYVVQGMPHEIEIPFFSDGR
jgi:hypothetical protein